jgi:hypothetical protein
MSAGRTFKQCGCRDGDGKRIGQTCARLRRANGSWSPGHGSWHFQLELPPYPGAPRRGPLRRGGFATQDAAGEEMDRVRELIAIAPAGDPEARARIADAIMAAIRETGLLPDPKFVSQGRRGRPRPRDPAPDHRRMARGPVAPGEEEAASRDGPQLRGPHPPVLPPAHRPHPHRPAARHRRRLRLRGHRRAERHS